MAKTKQFTIAINNQPGAVAEIARALGNSKVNILSLLGTAQGTAGTVQLIVEDARRAKKALDGQPEFHSRDRRERRQKGHRCLHRGSCYKSRNGDCVRAFPVFPRDPAPPNGHERGKVLVSSISLQRTHPFALESV